MHQTTMARFHKNERIIDKETLPIYLQKIAKKSNNYRASEGKISSYSRYHGPREGTLTLSSGNLCRP